MAPFKTVLERTSKYLSLKSQPKPDCGWFVIKSVIVWMLNIRGEAHVFSDFYTMNVTVIKNSILSLNNFSVCVTSVEKMCEF